MEGRIDGIQRGKKGEKIKRGRKLDFQEFGGPTCSVLISLQPATANWCLL